LLTAVVETAPVGVTVDSLPGELDSASRAGGVGRDHGLGRGARTTHQLAAMTGGRSRPGGVPPPRVEPSIESP
jgi:hypothetical protein